MSLNAHSVLPGGMSPEEAAQLQREMYAKMTPEQQRQVEMFSAKMREDIQAQLAAEANAAAKAEASVSSNGAIGGHAGTAAAAALGMAGPSQPRAAAATPPALPAPREFTGFELCQRGMIAELRSMVLEGRANVNARDEEGITMMHWAAINNRKDCVTFLSQEGADCDPRGGELDATPLHWAIRQGHLDMVVQLVRMGADPTTADNQGFNTLHVASQFGHALIMAYLMACGVSPDEPDRDGRTPLMWAAIKAMMPDPIRVLLAMGASINTTDPSGNTALHWAVVHENVWGVRLLVRAGADRTQANSSGKSPCDLVYTPSRSQLESGQLSHAKNAQIKHEMPPPDRPVDLLEAQKWRWWAGASIPFLVSCGLGAAAVLLKTHGIWYGLALLFATVMGASQAFRFLFQGHMTAKNPMQSAIYFGTKLQMYLTFFYVIWPVFSDVAGPLTRLVFYTLTATLFYHYYRTCTVEAGVVLPPGSADERNAMIRELAEQGKLGGETGLCVSTLARKPYRSKYCTVSEQRIEKFDHYCPFVNNAVGHRNHHHFLTFLGSLICINLMAWSFFYFYFLDVGCVEATTSSFFTTVGGWAACDPWLFWVWVQSVMHMTWVTMLFVMQMKQAMVSGLTTNEEINRYRYGYLQGRTRSPWHRGYIGNLVEMVQQTVDWSHVYTVPGHKFMA